jgi:DNA-binding response OmpR family regulator
VRLTLDTGDRDILEAIDGASALSAIRVLQPDLVVLDVMMPGELSGLDVCARIRADPGLRGIRVVILSARGQVTDRAEGLRAGADAYLVKPFSPLELERVVDTLLDDSAATGGAGEPGRPHG